jgi:hypothetical protein
MKNKQKFDAILFLCIVTNPMYLIFLPFNYLIRLWNYQN